MAGCRPAEYPVADIGSHPNAAARSIASGAADRQYYSIEFLSSPKPIHFRAIPYLILILARGGCDRRRQARP